jgi:hypothetical protein
MIQTTYHDAGFGVADVIVFRRICISFLNWIAACMRAIYTPATFFITFHHHEREA